jgi:hypothetical protein
VARRIDLIPLLRTQLCLTRKITQPGFFCFDFDDATFVMRKITQPRVFVVSPFVL